MAIYTGHNEDSSGNLLLSIGNGMTATVETSSTASQAYTKGSYVFFDNKLCKTTSAIASGATLAIGTNLSQTSLGAELTSHLRSSDGKEFYFDVKDGTYGYYPSASKTASEFVPFGGTPDILSTKVTAVAGYGQQIINISDNIGSEYIVCNLCNGNTTTPSISGGVIVKELYGDSETPVASNQGRSLLVKLTSTTATITLPNGSAGPGFYIKVA